MKEEILISPPPSDSELLKELDIISAQYKSRYNPDFAQDMLDKNPVDLFAGVVRDGGFDIKKSEIIEMKEEIGPYVISHKKFFNAPRPYELAEKYDIEFVYDDISSAKSPSYPSGHTAQAYYMAFVLSDRFPSLEGKLYMVADMIANSRIDRGVHFPSDNKAGVDLATKVFGIKRRSLTSSCEKKLERLASWLNNNGLEKESDLVCGLFKNSNASFSEQLFPLSIRSKRVGASYSHVLAAQKKLLEYGYHMDAGADGKFGKQTKDAVMEFQAENKERYGLSVTGELSEKDYSLLMFGDPNRAPKKTVIVALGDSITAGGYARYLKEYVPGTIVHKLGFGGKQTGFIMKKMDEALAKNPDYIIILAGVNDIASGRNFQHITSNLKRMYEQATDAGVKVIAVKILPWGARKSAAGKLPLTKKVNEWIESQRGGGLVYKVVEGKEMLSDDPTKYENNEMSSKYTGDGIHPNKDGKNMLARLIAEQAFGADTEQGFSGLMS